MCENTAKIEVSEILSLLPDVAGKKVLELGADIGRRFGCELAQRANHVTSVDLIKIWETEDINQNGHIGNADFLQESMTAMEFPNNSFDFAFSYGILMYLTDDEVRKLTGKVLSWLKEDGLVFFHAPCSSEKELKPSANRSRTMYDVIFQSVISTENAESQKERHFGFDLVFCRKLQSCLQYNGNSFCWLLHKTRRDPDAYQGFQTYQRFLDSKQFCRTSILKRERIFGEGFETTGGLETTKIFLQMLNLKPGQKVFNVASGIGGGDFYMSKKYGTENLSIDLSSNQIDIAMERAKKYKGIKVQFEIADVTKRTYPPGSFDVVYSRDTIKHITDKPALFSKFYRWLKPGGKLLLTDYCCGDMPHSEAFQKYVDWFRYTLCTPQQYGKIVKDAGFTNVKAEDRSWHLKEMLIKEMRHLENIKAAFIKEFSEEEFHGCLNAWSSKLKNVNSGDHAWVLVYAEKPAE